MRGYRATQQPNGTWTIHDVPIMAEVREGERGENRSVGREWLEAAVEKARMRHDLDGYVAPSHVHHHSAGKATERAGHLVPTSVRSMPYEGTQRATLFADLTDIPPSIYERIRAGELPYRSVEFEWGTPEILSLALMPDEVPFFRFGLLRIAAEQPNATETAPQRLTERSAPAVAMSAAQGSATQVLFMFREEVEMPEPNEGGAPPGGAVTLEQVMSAIQALPQAIVAALQGGTQQMAAPDGDESPIEEKLKDDDEKKDKEEMSADTSEETPQQLVAADPSNEAIAQLSAEIAGLKHRESQRDAREGRVKLVADAKASLVGWPLSGADCADLERFAAQGKPVLDAYVVAYKRNTPKDPPKDFESFQAREQFEDTETVMQFAAKGPNHLDAARKASAMFRRMKDVPGFKVDEATFVSDQVERLMAGNGEVR